MRAFLSKFYRRELGYGNIRLIKPYIEYVDVEADFRDVFETGVFTRGKNVKEFAQRPVFKLAQNTHF